LQNLEYALLAASAHKKRAHALQSRNSGSTHASTPDKFSTSSPTSAGLQRGRELETACDLPTNRRSFLCSGHGRRDTPSPKPSCDGQLQLHTRAQRLNAGGVQEGHTWLMIPKNQQREVTRTVHVDRNERSPGSAGIWDEALLERLELAYAQDTPQKADMVGVRGKDAAGTKPVVKKLKATPDRQKYVSSVTPERRRDCLEANSCVQGKHDGSRLFVRALLDDKVTD